MSVCDHVKSSAATVCFVSKNSPQHYKDLDLSILRRHFNVIRHDYVYTFRNVFRFIDSVRHSDVVFSWFASPWMALMLVFVPRRVRVVVVAGGYDVANCKELNHGARFHPIKGWLTRQLLKRASLVLPVSDFCREEMLSWVSPRSETRIYNAVDFPEFSLIPNQDRKPKVITVGIIRNFISKCKGHHRFVEVARRLPEFEFVLMGKVLDGTIDVLREVAPSNVRFIDYTSRDQMISEMLSSSVYLQLSYYESFGVSLAEGIACGCFPVLTEGNALVEVAGGVGAVVDGDDYDGIASLIREAHDSGSYRDIDVSRVRKDFSVERRELALREAICGLLGVGN